MINKIPKINFSDWVLWSSRNNIEGINDPGVYLLAHLEIQKSLSPDEVAQEIIYIGETCDQTLRTRWGAFNSCAFANSNGHSGGVKYRKIFKGKEQDYLYVSAFPVNLTNKIIQSSFIRYTERKLILEYVLQWGNFPICNSK